MRNPLNKILASLVGHGRISGYVIPDEMMWDGTMRSKRIDESKRSALFEKIADDVKEIANETVVQALRYWLILKNVNDFDGLAAHMGVTHEAAMLEALNDWVTRNAEIYDYTPSTTEETTDDTSHDA